MQDKIEEHDRDIRPARTETAAVSEHAYNTGHKPLWNEIKFIDRDPYYYMRRVKEAIHVRIHPDNISRNSRSVDAHDQKTQQQQSRGTADRRGSKSLSETGRFEMHQSEQLKEQLITAEHHAL